MCDAYFGSPSKKPKVDPAPNSPASVNQETSRCGGSCADPSECDINSDCICASDKGIPLSSTWGTFSCTFVANAAAVVAVAAQYASDCRGRCTLDANGTLDIAATATVPVQDPLAPELTCPCNCTYVSHACCLSQTRIVWEDPAEKVDTTVQAPNGTVCCDASTGDWTATSAQRDDPLLNPACLISSQAITSREKSIRES